MAAICTQYRLSIWKKRVLFSIFFLDRTLLECFAVPRWGRPDSGGNLLEVLMARKTILFALTLALFATFAMADSRDKARIMRVTMQDGSTKQFLVEHLQNLTFVADEQDSSGMDEKTPEERESELPDKIDVTTQMVFGAVTISEDRATATINGSFNKPSMTYFTEDITVQTVTLDRTFNTTLTGNLYSTIMLPFSIDLAYVHGAKFYDLSIQTDPEMLIVGTLKESGELEAYKPYLIQATEEHITFTSSVTFKKYARNPVVNGYWEFRGSYNYFVFGDSTQLMGNSWGYSAKNMGQFNVGQFVKLGERAYIYPMRAYLVYTGPKPQGAVSMHKRAALADASPAPDVDYFPESIDVEIIEKKTAEKSPTKGAVGQFRLTDPYHFDNWYDLQGRNVKASPEAQGNYYNKSTRKTVK